MIGVDTNLLVYAHREETSWHARAVHCLRELAEGRSAWAIPWPCVHEFLAIVTHPRIFLPPSPQEVALECVAAWMESPGLVLLSEGTEHWPHLRRAVETGRIDGPRVHDARIACLCLQHGVREFWSADRDFQRFPQLKVVNPLVA